MMPLTTQLDSPSMCGGTEGDHTKLVHQMVELVLVILAILFFEQMIANAGSFDDPVLFLIIPVGAAILAVSIGFFKWATH